MKLTALHVFFATQVLAKIINEKRPMPLKGAYRMARLQTKLQPEFQLLDQKRNEMIQAYDYRAVPAGAPEGTEEVPMVPASKLDDFAPKWDELMKQEIEVGVEPIPLSHLSLGDAVAGSITAQELLVLDTLVVDDTDVPVATVAKAA